MLSKKGTLLTFNRTEYKTQSKMEISKDNRKKSFVAFMNANANSSPR